MNSKNIILAKESKRNCLGDRTKMKNTTVNSIKVRIVVNFGGDKRVEMRWRKGTRNGAASSIPSLFYFFSGGYLSSYFVILR